MFEAGQRVKVVAPLGADHGRLGTFEGEYGQHHLGGWVRLDGEDDAEAFEYFELEAVE